MSKLALSANDQKMVNTTNATVSNGNKDVSTITSGYTDPALDLEFLNLLLSYSSLDYPQFNLGKLFHDILHDNEVKNMFLRRGYDFDTIIPRGDLDVIEEEFHEAQHLEWVKQVDNVFNSVQNDYPLTSKITKIVIAHTTNPDNMTFQTTGSVVVPQIPGRYTLINIIDAIARIVKLLHNPKFHIEGAIATLVLRKQEGTNIGLGLDVA